MRPGSRLFLIAWTMLLAAGSAVAGSAAAEPLTLEDRIEAQHAIEEVYWAHRIWPSQNPQPKPPLDTILTREDLRRRVESYLRASAALETIHDAPLTSSDLAAEIERMARNTRRPSMLRELFEALDNDPRLVAECLARPLLADRRLRRLHAGDDTFEDRWNDIENRVPSTIQEPGGPDSLPEISGRDDCTLDSWILGGGSEIPVARIRHSTVWTGTEMIVWGGRRPVTDRGEIYTPATDSWRAVTRSGAPAPRYDHTAVWTGSTMIVWGGLDEDDNQLDDGGTYDPSGPGSWTALPLTGAPSPRSGHTAVWTGDRMIVWGGISGVVRTNTGGVYDPAGGGSWAVTSLNLAPASRTSHTAVWTGTHMIVWGGHDGTQVLDSGGRYDPAGGGTWIPVNRTGAPAPRQEHTAVWTGDRMVVWGGNDGNAVFPAETDTGGFYEPDAGLGTWTDTPLSGAPAARSLHTAVFTGTAMIVWGGRTGSSIYTATGGVLDTTGPGSWSSTSTINAPVARRLHTAVWTGDRMIVWGGESGSTLHDADTGGIYDPAGPGTWTDAATSPGTYYVKRSGHSLVWTGSEALVWGGQYYAYGDSGGRYDPATDHWTEIPRSNAPRSRYWHTAVWSGTDMIVWGGQTEQLQERLRSGGQFNPATVSWKTTSLVDAPEGRAAHTALWTGTHMIVWGGLLDAGYADTGGMFDPADGELGSWTPIPTAGAPTGRRAHTAVWTGDRMIVWGGYDGSTRVDTGGVLDPAGAGSWTATATTGAPAGRSDHTAVWTGSEMIVFGGTDGTTVLDTGGHYDPAGSGSWTPTATDGAPDPRAYHVAVWTGARMVVWSGRVTDVERFDTGGVYDPEGTGSWTPTTTDGAPTRRNSATAVFDGEGMMVIGGGWPDHSFGTYCACTAELTYYLDDDGDGHGDPLVTLESCDPAPPDGYAAAGDDCDDSNPSAWARPGETSNLAFAADKTTMTWDPPAEPGGDVALLLYDLLRSGDAADFVSDAMCVLTDAGAAQATDGTEPGAGQALHYLSRAQSTCPDGEGSLGRDGDGVEREGRSCP